MAQVNRGSEERATRKPRLSDLRESGSLEQDADTVLMLHRPDPSGNLMEVEVAKNRNGPTGEVRLMWVPQYMMFANAEQQTGPVG